MQLSTPEIKWFQEKNMVGRPSTAAYTYSPSIQEAKADHLQAQESEVSLGKIVRLKIRGKIKVSNLLMQGRMEQNSIFNVSTFFPFQCQLLEISQKSFKKRILSQSGSVRKENLSETVNDRMRSESRKSILKAQKIKQVSSVPGIELEIIQKSITLVEYRFGPLKNMIVTPFLQLLWSLFPNTFIYLSSNTTSLVTTNVRNILLL